MNETDEHPHMFGEIKNKIKERKQEKNLKQEQELKKLETQTYEILYQNYKNYRKHYYAYERELDDFAYSYLARVTIEATEKKVEKEILPKLKHLNQGKHYISLGAESIYLCVAPKTDEIQNDCSLATTIWGVAYLSKNENEKFFKKEKDIQVLKSGTQAFERKVSAYLVENCEKSYIAEDYIQSLQVKSKKLKTTKHASPEREA